MDQTARAAFIMAQAAMLNAEIAAMQAANAQYPNDQPYGEEAFKAKIEQYEPILGLNAVIEFMKEPDYR